MSTRWKKRALVSSFAAVVRNVFIFPGVPKLMRGKFMAIRQLFEGKTLYTERVYLSVRETIIAIGLEEIQRKHPNISIGSYPQFDAGDIKVILTVESQEESEALLVKGVLEEAYSDYLLPPPNSDT